MSRKRVEAVLVMTLAAAMFFQTPETLVASGMTDQNGISSDAGIVETGDKAETLLATTNGWKKENGNWYYYKNGKRVTGWLQYDGCWYYLDSDGVMCTGWKKIDGNWYYFRSWGGAYQNTFFEYDGSTYYADDQCVMAVGWKRIDGNWYYFRSWGGMYRDTLFEYDHELYYVNSDGVMQTGWVKRDGNWYYFQNWGGAYRSTFFEYDNCTYYADGQGVMQTDWLELDGNWYYFRSWGGMYQSTFFEYDGCTYYADDQGVMQTGWLELDGKKYYFRSWGGMYRDQFFTCDGENYYADRDGCIAIGWNDIQGEEYYFGETGILVKEQWFDTERKPTDEKPTEGFYYTDGDGVLRKDSYVKQPDENGTEIYYSFDSNGECIYSSDTYVKAKDPVNGTYYILEHQYYTDPRVDDRDLMTAICYAEANDQKKTGMTAVAMVIRNRMDADQCSLRTVIYKKQQFEPARSGVLTKLLEEINEGETTKFSKCGAYDAVEESDQIMTQYLTEGTNRVIDNFGDEREDFDYLYFMTPEAFEKQDLDPEKCITYTYTYRWTVNGEEKSSSHVFFVKWVKKS
ncbi:MAG: hypothetical protein ACI4EG_13525 [Fusicatenibacter sp.]